jgi:hypothetical protein
MTTYEAKGTQFFVNTEVGDSPPDSDYVAFCVTSIDPIGSARGLIDVTTLCSEAREYKLALQDGQEIKVEAFYDPNDAVQEMLRLALENGTTVSFKIVLSSGRIFLFDALVTGWSIGAAIDSVYPLHLTLKPTGPIQRA